MAEKLKTGIALSGGAARGVAHIGVLKALNEANIYPDVIAGTSSGAVVGVFYAAGYSPDDILNIVLRQDIPGNLKFEVAHNHFMDSSELMEILFEHLELQNFEELQLPFFITTADLLSGTLKIHHKGRLYEPLKATTSVPLMFGPVDFAGGMDVDGGLISNLPVEPLLGKCHHIIGVYVNPVMPIRKIRSVKSVMERSLEMALGSNILINKEKCDYFIEPGLLSAFSLLELSKLEDMYQTGYEFTRDYLKKQDIDHLRS